MEPAEPDMGPLGYLALGVAALGAFFAATPLFPLAYLPAGIALVLGWLSLHGEASRGFGTAAIALAGLVVIAATAAFVLIGLQ